MSNGAIFMALMLLASIHGCNARRTPPGFGIHKNNIGIGKTKVGYEMDIKSLHAFENTKQTDSGDDASMSITTPDDIQKSTIHTQGLGRNERSMRESDQTHKNKEPSDVNDDEPVEDAVVMDYVTPHRKSPIHNHYEAEQP